MGIVVFFSTWMVESLDHAIGACAFPPFVAILGVVSWFLGKQMMQQVTENPGLGCVYGPFAYLMPLFSIAYGWVVVRLPIILAGSLVRHFGYEVEETALSKGIIDMPISRNSNERFRP